MVSPRRFFLPCLSAAEALARAKQQGLWAINASRLPYRGLGKMQYVAGFQLLRGKVLELTKGKMAHWLSLDSGVKLRISEVDRVYFQSLRLNTLSGKTIEVRGWLLAMNRKMKNADSPIWLTHLRHPTMLSVL